MSKVLRTILLSSPLLLLGCGGAGGSSDSATNSSGLGSTPANNLGTSFAYHQQTGVCIETATSNLQEQSDLRTAGFTESSCDKSTYLSSCAVDTFDGQTLSNPFVTYYEFNSDSPKSAYSQAKDYESACALIQGIYQRGPYASPDLPTASDPVVPDPISANYQTYYFDTDTLFNNQVFHIEEQKYYEIANPGDSVELVTQTSEQNKADHLLALFTIKRANNDVDLLQFNAGTGELIEIEGAELNHLSCVNDDWDGRHGNSYYAAFLVWQKIDDTRSCESTYDIDSNESQFIGFLEDKTSINLQQTVHASQIVKENNLITFENGIASGVFYGSYYYALNSPDGQGYIIGENGVAYANDTSQEGNYILVKDHYELSWATLDAINTAGDIDSLTANFTFKRDPSDISVFNLSGKTFVSVRDTAGAEIDEQYLFEFDQSNGELIQRAKITQNLSLKWFDTGNFYVAISVDPRYTFGIYAHFFNKTTWVEDSSLSFYQEENERYEVYDAGDRILIKTNSEYYFITDEGLNSLETSLVNNDEVYALTNPYAHPQLGNPAASFYSLASNEQVKTISKLTFNSENELIETTIASFETSVDEDRREYFWIGTGFETTSGKWLLSRKYFGDSTSANVNQR